MNLSYDYAESLAPNAGAIKNGKSLAKDKFVKLNISEDETIIFGECQGSGKTNYLCSMDFIDPTNPIARCSCPSRQIPCKHALGLMFAYLDGNEFSKADIPDDILTKRDKLNKRVANKAAALSDTAKSEEVKPPTNAKINSAIKKINLQLEGIENAEKILKSILQTGLASIDPQTLKLLEQQVKKLGNYHINGIQIAFNDLIISIRVAKDGSFEEPIEKLIYINSLLKKSTEYLKNKKDDEELLFKFDLESSIDEQIGHLWKLEELFQNGKYIDNAKIIQLGFYSYDSPARREIIEEGYYICLNDKKIYKTINYRPFRALKYVKSDDSIFSVLEIERLYIYPGNINPRIRWDGYAMTDTTKEDFTAINSSAHESYESIIKEVKNQLKSPLSDNFPFSLLKISDIEFAKDANGKEYIHIIDSLGKKQILSDDSYIEASTVSYLKMFGRDMLVGNSLLIVFENNIEDGLLYAKPISIITNNDIIRLAY